ncbi:MAG: methionyl-tRNA formyltransferase [Acidobacteriota bacterium]
MEIVFMGTPKFALPSLRRLVKDGHEIQLLVTRQDKPKGRGQKVAPPPTKELAISQGIPVEQPTDLRSPDFYNRLKSLRPEVIVVVAYGKILPQELLDLPPYGGVNLHASLLPRYRGACPINWALINGEQETGVTTIKMSAEMDAGDILLARQVAIAPGETAEELEQRLSLVGAELLSDTLARLQDGRLSPRPQDHSQATFAPRLKKEDGRIDWGKAAMQIFNATRGLAPWPGAYSIFRGKTVIFRRGELFDVPAGRELPVRELGEIVALDKRGIVVQCGDGAYLLIAELQPESRRRMRAVDFVNGYRVKPGERFA